MEEEENDGKLLFVTVLDYEESLVYCYKMPISCMDEPTFMVDLQRELEVRHGDKFDFMTNFTHPNDITVEWMIDEVFFEDEYEVELDN